MAIVPADLFLSATLTADEAGRYLAGFGFADPATADARLQALAGDVQIREALARLADVLLDTVKGAPDPDAGLAAFVRHVESRSAKATFLEALRADPRALGLLVDAAGRSPFVADALQRSPELLHWLVTEVHRAPPGGDDLAADAAAMAAPHADAEAREAALVRLQRRELLRVAVRDVLGRESLDTVSRQLGALADVTLTEALRAGVAGVVKAARGAPLPGRIGIIALGRLGASELDYAPDVELVFVYEPDAEDDPSAHTALREVAGRTVDLLSRAASAGDLYRLDLPVHAAALAGAPAASLRRWQAYCAGLSDHRLRLAFVRARAVAGDPGIQARTLAAFTAYAYEAGPVDGPLADLRRRLSAGEAGADDDVRNGVGGLADIEAFTSTLQLVAGRDRAGVRVPGTSAALAALVEAGALTEQDGVRLADVFATLRRVEQRLSLARGDLPPTLDDPGALDLAAAAFDQRDPDAFREHLYSERLTARAICRQALTRL